MILLCGIPSEPPLARVAEALRAMRQAFFVFNQRRFADTRIELAVEHGSVTGWLECGTESYRLEDFRGVYVRLMDDRCLPELEGKAGSSETRVYCRRLHETLSIWLELTDARILNRPSAMASNSSKPFQSQLIRRYGLLVPETLVTNDPDHVLEFRQRHGRVVFKSTSGVRSIVKALDDSDIDRLQLVRWCPTQFQQLVEGVDIRVHVVGSQTFATRVRSGAVDYRYAHTLVGEPAELEACELPEDLAGRCVAMANGMDLPLAGIDLRMTPEGDVYCFEVNPCPGFSYYEDHTGQPIADAIAAHLAGRVSREAPSRAIES